MKTIVNTILSTSAKQTMQIGAALAKLLQPGDVVGLTGELGAGKTQFVRGMAQGMHIASTVVSSPTFVLMQEYELDDETAPVLVHIDAYRLAEQNDNLNHGALDKPADLAMATIGWEGAGEEIRQGAVVAIEWANLVRDALPDDTIDVTLTHNGGNRNIEITAPVAKENLIRNLQLLQI